MMKWYEVDLAESREYDYTKGDTITIAVASSVYPNADDIDDFINQTNYSFSNLKTCNIVEIDKSEEVIPYVEKIIYMN